MLGAELAKDASVNLTDLPKAQADLRAACAG